MVKNLSDQHTIANRFIAELRDTEIQKDSMRFRKNLERLGEIFAYEISKTLLYQEHDVETPLGTASTHLPEDQLVLATIMRAGLPFHQGLLNYFDDSSNAFISAFRKNHKDGSFEVHVDYVSCPPLRDKVLILSDPMLATGSSMVLALKALLEYGRPRSIHLVTIIASIDGVEYVRRNFPDVKLWMGAMDEELTAKSYIVPGLGDAGDLCYGMKI